MELCNGWHRKFDACLYLCWGPRPNYFQWKVVNFPTATVNLTFVVGSAITIYGLTSSYSGNFSVTLDNITTNLSAISSYNNSNSLLFYATDLPQDIVHHVAVVNQENSTLALQVGGINITYFGNSTTYAISLPQTKKQSN